MSAIGNSNAYCSTDFNRDQRIGMAFVATTGGVSAMAIIILLLLFARNVYRSFTLSRHNGPKFEIIRTHVDAYFLSLLVADLFQSVGALLNIRWAKLGRVHCGTYCNLQGAYKQLGETGVALATMVISIHTFLIIFFRWSPPKTRMFSGMVIGIIWIFLLLFVSLGFTQNVDFYTPIPYWCWIGDRYNTLRIVAEYLWMWMAAVLSLVLYPLLFLRLRGNVVVDPENWSRISFHLHKRVVVDESTLTPGSVADLPLPIIPAITLPPEHMDRTQTLPQLTYDNVPEPLSAQESSAKNEETKLAIAMLGYPVCYIVLVLPLSITRWMSFVGTSDASFAATATTLALFGLSGSVNVVLFMCTRPNLLLFGRGKTRRPVSRTGDADTADEQRIGKVLNHDPALPLNVHEDGAPHFPRASSRESTPYASDLPFPRRRFHSNPDIKDAAHLASDWPQYAKSISTASEDSMRVNTAHNATAQSDSPFPPIPPSLLPVRVRSRAQSSARRLLTDPGTLLDEFSFSQSSPISAGTDNTLESGRREEGGDYVAQWHTVRSVETYEATVGHTEN